MNSPGAMPAEARAGGARARVLAALRAAGARGCTNVELASRCCLAFCQRIRELRVQGFEISTEPAGGGLFRYTLHGEPRVIRPLPRFLRRRAQTQTKLDFTEVERAPAPAISASAAHRK